MNATKVIAVARTFEQLRPLVTDTSDEKLIWAYATFMTVLGERRQEALSIERKTETGEEF